MFLKYPYSLLGCYCELLKAFKFPEQGSLRRSYIRTYCGWFSNFALANPVSEYQTQTPKNADEMPGNSAIEF
ncbi:uncharacterized protein N7484_008252 [Penicillium longicatenatum]|uniref:uncharacterized protein n=1 Tax=Penicillium longicatenatum TaxID=1561947 RepID=UPI0025494E26|nr:uncharacterized protein N7484_008252 [Penicillium longicatenatum]KAJ5634939.1 hypothetical protein N7484_008252 [Penicillium longicatenatum]